MTRLQETAPGLDRAGRVFTPETGTPLEEAKRNATAASEALTTGPWQEPDGDAAVGAVQRAARAS